MSHYGYCMINSFNKYLLRVYYMPGGKFNESVQALSPNPMWLSLVSSRTKFQLHHKSLKRFFEVFALDGLTLCKTQVTQCDSEENSI